MFFDGWRVGSLAATRRLCVAERYALLSISLRRAPLRKAFASRLTSPNLLLIPQQGECILTFDEDESQTIGR